MKKHLAALTSLIMAFSLAACFAKQDEAIPAETEKEAVSETVSEAAVSEAVGNVSFSYIGKWHFIRADMTAKGITLAMSLKDMEISELTAENSFILEIKDSGTVDISAYGKNASAEWKPSDSGITITGEEETLGANVLDFTSEDTDLIKTTLSFEEEEMDMYFAREGSPKIEESMNKSLLEDTFGAVLGDMINENMTELTLDAPVTLSHEENTAAMYCGFTAPEAGSYTFRSESGGYDIAAVYDPSSFAKALAVSDNTEGGFELTIELEAEQTIYIEVTSGSKEVTVSAQKN